MNWLALVVLIVAAYLVSAFPSGVLWGRLIKGVDVRQYGSGKTGATNSLRALGWQISLLVFATDMAKGALAVGLPMLFSGMFFKENGQDNTPWVVLACGLASIIGHNYSIFIGLKGGRGVACGMGQHLVITPLGFALLFLTDVWVLVFSRYVSLTSVMGCVLAEVFLVLNIWLTNLDPRYAVWGLVVPGFIIISHRDNIQRLLNGTERKLGQKAKPIETTEPVDKAYSGAAEAQEKAGK
jgi:acyl phosphate:glycerol-3-phosphate acyltransferase